jgi:hypothetical protein
MILTVEDIRLIFDKIGREVVVPSTVEFPYEIVSARSQGYHADPAIGKLQAKLSIMLQMASAEQEMEEREGEVG